MSDTVKTLVVIPTLMLEASFSAPLAWLFSQHADQVKGIFGFELTSDMARRHHRFILHLNWFIELHEFGLLARFIRSHNPGAEILFGGMFASIHLEEIFRRHPVDYAIRGDNEWPLQQYLNGVSPRAIPNFVGRDFANPISYVFKEEDYLQLDLNLDWFPSHFRYRDPANLFLAPHIVTAKGGCNVVHDGCEYCMGAKHDHLFRIFGRPPIAMRQQSLMHLLHNAEKRFQAASLYITNANDYDFSERRFDLDVTIEIDSPVTPPQAAAILHAFPRAFMLLPAYDEGIAGKAIAPSRYADLIGLEDAEHQIRFYVFRKDAKASSIPRGHVVFSEYAFPEAADWSFYTNFDSAEQLSRRFYASCERHFADGQPTNDGKNASYYLQNLRFSQGFR